MFRTLAHAAALPDGCKAYVADREAAFRKELARQQAGGKPG